jgi:hypothetical protein
MHGRSANGWRVRLRLGRLNAKPQHGHDEKQCDLNSAQRFLHSRPADELIRASQSRRFDGIPVDNRRYLAMRPLKIRLKRAPNFADS